MTNRELFALGQNLVSAPIREIKNTKVNYAIEKTKDKIEAELKVVRKLVEAVPDYKEYVEDLKNIRDSENDDKAKKGAAKAIDEVYKDVIDKVNEIDEMENIGFAPFKIKYSDLPEDLSSAAVQILFPLIQE